MLGQNIEQSLEAKIYEYIGTFLTIKSDLYNIKKMCDELSKKYKDGELISIKTKADELEAKQGELSKTLSELSELLKKKQYIALIPKAFTFYTEADRLIYEVNELKKRLDSYMIKKPLIDVQTILPYVVGAGVAILGLSLVRRR